MKSQKHSKSALGILWRLALTFAFLLWALPGHSEERRVEKRVPPVYPEIAKRMRIGGIVHVEATVSPDGSVTAVKAVSGNKMLSPAAEEAVKRWKFAPGDGPATVGVDINFELN
ncbi:energy transducer TonB [Pseudacidobacterium ailaaui]|jgi:TonB family protein|uniref:energy transducer TonB n=1 Tax=Pseudacidobacterium ailaaui TaxID=1382359 RepID=UPI0009DE4954|nr:energy transducer TonB [Pseudacidobacterium ailaaui]MDI3254340.1 energy transducer TonB [Bacillota bacterium]